MLASFELQSARLQLGVSSDLRGECPQGTLESVRYSNSKTRVKIIKYDFEQSIGSYYTSKFTIFNSLNEISPKMNSAFKITHPKPSAKISVPRYYRNFRNISKLRYSFSHFALATNSLNSEWVTDNDINMIFISRSKLKTNQNVVQVQIILSCNGDSRPCNRLTDHHNQLIGASDYLFACFPLLR